MEYTIVKAGGIMTGGAIGKLIKSVNLMIAEGWIPIGGVVMVGSYALQTMTRGKK